MKRTALAGVLMVAAVTLWPSVSLADPAPLAIYGLGEGSAAGQMDGASGSVVDAAGNVYVAEESGHRISVFAADGAFLRAFGEDVVPGGGTGPEVCTAATGCQTGTITGGPGSLYSPYGLARTTEGLLLVADFTLERVSVWTPEGSFVRAFGKDVVPGGPAGPEVCTTSCQAGTGGGAGGEFDGPIGLAPVGDGSFFVAEYFNNRVSVVRPDGGFVRAFGKDVVPGGSADTEVCTTSCQAGTLGGGPGELASPTGVASSPGGDVFIGEQPGNRISAFAADGAFLRAFGKDVDPGGGTGAEVCAASCQTATAGSAAGELFSPDALAFDGAGNLHAGEQSNARVSVFTPTGAFLRAYGEDVDPGGANGFENCTTSCQEGVSSSDAPGAFTTPFIAGADCRGAVLIGDTEADRVQRIGEPGTAPPPCPLELGKAKRNKKKGTATLEVEVPEPGPGDLELRGRGLKTKKIADVSAGETLLKLKGNARTRKRLNENGKARVRAKVEYTPLGGVPETVAKKLKLKRRR